MKDAPLLRAAAQLVAQWNEPLPKGKSEAKIKDYLMTHSPTPPKVQAPPPPEWAVKAALAVSFEIAAASDRDHGIAANFTFNLEQVASIIARCSPAPASEGRSEETEAVNDMAALESLSAECAKGATEFLRQKAKTWTWPKLITTPGVVEDIIRQSFTPLVAAAAGPALSSRKPNSVAAHYPGAGVERKQEGT